MFSFGTRLRRSATIWTAPLWIALTALYFLVNRDPIHSWQRWAPMLSDWVTKSVGALSYAAAFGLAIWAGGQVKRDGVWTLAPARTRVRIVVGALAAPIGLACAIVVVPVAVRLVSLRLSPTPVVATAEPVVMTLGIAVCWAAGGFVVGQVAPRLLAAPIGVAASWYAVVSAASYDHPTWPRHVLGQIDGGLDFGERYRLVTVGVPLLFAAIAAAALIAIWMARLTVARIAVIVIAPAALVACAHIASGWRLGSAPVASASPPRNCDQGTTDVCIAATGGQVARLGDITHTVDATYAALRQAGIRTSVPARIVDSLLPRSRHRALPAGEVRVPLTIEAARHGMPGITYQTLYLALPFGCVPPDHDLVGRPVPRWMSAYDTAMLWAAGKAGVARQYRHGLRAGYSESGRRGEKAADRVIGRVTAIHRLSPHAQAVWFAHQRRRVCRLTDREVGH